MKVISTTEKGWRLNKRMKSTIYVKLISRVIKRGMKNHVRGFFEDSSPYTATFHFGTNSLKNIMKAQKILQLT